MTRRIYDKVRCDLNDDQCPHKIYVYVPWALKNLELDDSIRERIKTDHYGYLIYHIDRCKMTKNEISIKWMKPIKINGEYLYTETYTHIPFKHIRLIDY